MRNIDNPFIKLPTQYNHIIQAVILNLINDEKYNKFIHDNGFSYEKRQYKMFVFSRLYGNYEMNIKDRSITFKEFCDLYISSIDDAFIKYFLDGVFEKEILNISGQNITIDKITAVDCVLKKEIKVKTLSPIVVYSTLRTEDDRKKTYYYSPKEKEFEDQIKSNLIKKYIAFYNSEPTDSSFRMDISDRGALKERVITYKSIILKGWDGVFKVNASEEMMEMMFCTGLGAKNSIGMGFVTPLTKEV